MNFASIVKMLLNIATQDLEALSEEILAFLRTKKVNVEHCEVLANLLVGIALAGPVERRGWAEQTLEESKDALLEDTMDLGFEFQRAFWRCYEQELLGNKELSTELWCEHFQFAGSWNEFCAKVDSYRLWLPEIGRRLHSLLRSEDVRREEWICLLLNEVRVFAVPALWALQESHEGEFYEEPFVELMTSLSEVREELIIQRSVEQIRRCDRAVQYLKSVHFIMAFPEPPD